MQFAQVPKWTMYYYLAMSVLLWIPSMVLFILAMNKDVMKFVLKSSEFWIQVVYAALRPILLGILFHQVGRHRNIVPQYIGYIYYIFALVNNTLFMVLVGGSDAIPMMTSKWKIIIAGLVATASTFFALAAQFLLPSSDDYLVEIKTAGSVLSFHSMVANVSGMLAIFLWKHVLDVIRNKDRCISISYRPYLRWEIPGNNLDLPDSVLPS